MKPTDEQKRITEQLLQDEWLPAKKGDTQTERSCRNMITEGWLVKADRPCVVKIAGWTEEGEVRPHYALTHKGITELVKPTYRLTWDGDYAYGRHSYRSQQGHYTIEKVAAKYEAKCSQYDRDWTGTFDLLKDAKDACRVHDWSFVSRRPMRKVAKHTWTAAGGRITVRYLTAPELRTAMPSGHTTTTPGYAIYVDGRYRDCGFNLHAVQHMLGYVGRKCGGRVELPEDQAA